MLKSRNLDDQSFDEIMDFAMGRLPWLCPSWTDYNAHDPGITILELLAWYKEMQQFHLNTVTGRMQKKMLKLVGVKPAQPQPAQCFIEMPPGAQHRRKLSRLETAEGVPFELLSDIEGDAAVSAVYVADDNHLIEVTGVIGQPNISITPFAYDGGDTELLIGLEKTAQNRIRLWFEIDDEWPVARNPFFSEGQQPRIIEWSFVGAGVREPLKDETHALSVSGYVEFQRPEIWPRTDGGRNCRQLHYLKLRLIDPGCEEVVRLRSISAGHYRISQQETWSLMESFVIENSENAAVTLTDALSFSGNVFAFMRLDSGLCQVEFQESVDESGKTIVLDGRAAMQDGSPNLITVSADQLRGQDLFLSSSGLPNMTVQLPLSGRIALTGCMGLICDTIDCDGQIRPALWRYVDDLSGCGPRDYVFTFDQLSECLIFGDGEHGAIVPRGENAILVAPLVLSYCENGNIPEGYLSFTDDGLEAANTAATQGAAAQSVEEAGREFQRKLQISQKCAATSDYERAALSAPGLRVAKAKAIAGYDPDEPAGSSSIPVVTVVAVPYSGREYPLPDQRFLDVVYARLRALRPICTKLKVIAPRYVPVGLYAQVRAGIPDAAKQLEAAVADYLTQLDIGDGVMKNDLIARIMNIDGIYKVEKLELRQLSADCYITAGGEMLTPQNAIAYLAHLDVAVKQRGAHEYHS